MADFDAAAGLSFAHLAGLALAASASDDDENDKKAPAAESDEDGDEDEKPAKKDSKKAKKAVKEDDEESAEWDDADASEEDDDADEDEDEDEDDKPVKRPVDAKSATKAERTHWAAVLGSKAFARAPALGAKMLATTGLSAKAIVGMLREAQAASAPRSASASRSERNPTVGANAPAPRGEVSASIDRMAALMGARSGAARK